MYRILLDIRISKIFLQLQTLVWIFHGAAADFVVTAPPEPVVVAVGRDVVLDCQLVPAKDLDKMEIRWIGQSGYATPVHMYKNGMEDLTHQPLEYRDRTELFLNQIGRGNLSLRIRNVRVSDKGVYKCFVAFATQHDEVKVTLNVAGTGQQPQIGMEGYTRDGVRLGCRSARWFPQPPVRWVNGQGEEVAAQPQTEYQTDLQGLTAVQSFIEVSKQSKNEYACVIDNRDLRETLEAHIRIADVFFPHSSGWMVAFLILFFLVAAAIGAAFWFYRKLRSEIQGLEKSSGLVENNNLREEIEIQKQKANQEYERLQREIAQVKSAGKLECEKLQQNFEEEKAAIKAEHKQFKAEIDKEKAAEAAKYQKLHTEFEQWRPLVLSERKRIESYAAAVKIDPRTANASLSVSPDGQTVKGGETQQVPDNPERFDCGPYALGEGGFTEGTHYWVVQVANKTYWDVGVANGSVQRKGMPNLCSDAGFWTLGRDGDPYGISDSNRSRITVTDRPEKIGVFLELEAGRVSFYNADTMFHLYTFNTYFLDKVYPFFWPGWDDAPLSVCPVKS